MKSTQAFDGENTVLIEEFGGLAERLGNVNQRAFGI
jgi:hypothetical protein